MDYKIRTNWETICRVARLTKNMGLLGLITGDKLDYDFSKIYDKLFEKGLMNEFCQAITGVDTDFEKELEQPELESVILAFFEPMREYYQTSKIMKILVTRVKQEIALMNPSLKSDSDSENTE